jgi:hypothetical protein
MSGYLRSDRDASMPEASKYEMTAHCECGRVALAMIGAPITSVVCYCDDCQEGARQIEALPDAPPVKDPDGGTAYIVYRKDRVRCSTGSQLLKSHKIKKGTATNRVVATCCNTALFLNFDDSKHWVDVYRARVRGVVPPLQMRICTKFKPGDGGIPADAPGYPAYPFKFLARLLAAKLAMMVS